MEAISYEPQKGILVSKVLISYSITEKDLVTQMKLKIVLKNDVQSTQPNLASCRIKLDATEKNKFETIENMITNKLQGFGVMKGNFGLFWQDDKGDFNVIKDNDDLSEALDESNGPLYELIACFLPKGNQGEKIIQYFINNY